MGSAHHSHTVSMHFGLHFGNSGQRESFSAYLVNESTFSNPAIQPGSSTPHRTASRQLSVREQWGGVTQMLSSHRCFFLVLVKDKACILSVKSKTKAPAGKSPSKSLEPDGSVSFA